MDRMDDAVARDECPRRLLGARRYSRDISYARFQVLYIESFFPFDLANRDRAIYLHLARFRVAKSARSQVIVEVEATAEPHHYYGHQIRRQRPGQRHLLSAGTAAVHSGGLIVARACCATRTRTCTLVRLDIHSRRCLDLVNHRRRRLFRWLFRLRLHVRLVTGALLEAVLVVGERTVAGTAAGTVPRFFC